MAVNRRNLRAALTVTLLFAAGFAAWSWFRPYAWSVDRNARCEVVGCQVKRDRSNFWVDVHLKMTPGQTHDLMKPVLLLTSEGGELEPAETTLGGSDDGGTSDLWFKFWLETREIEGPLTLRINDGTLVIRKNSGMPALGANDLEYFVTNHW